MANTIKPKVATVPPAIVPCLVGVIYPIWEQYGERLERLQQECPHVKLGGKDGRNSPDAVEHTSRDEWGILWHHPGMNLAGVAVEYPLADWAKFKTWQPPSPDAAIAAIKAKAAARKETDPEEAWHGGLDHGFIFLRLTYLRGFDNFMMDVAEDNPMLYELRDIVTDYWYRIVQAHLDCGATLVGAGDDLGMQDRLPISPAAWRQLIKPAYGKIIGLVRERGAKFALHTDGWIVDIIPDLIETGVTQLNPQDLVNGLDNLVRLAKGKVVIALDIDRQALTYSGTPAQVTAHIENCIRTLGSPQGGLSLIWGVYEGTPIANIEAGVRAMEKYHDMWAK